MSAVLAPLPFDAAVLPPRKITKQARRCFTKEDYSMSLRLERKIAILNACIPVREGTRLYAGFEALSTCNGKTYRHFRSLCGGPVGSKDRRFSPSAVWRSAEATGFARFEDGALTIPPRTLQDSYSDPSAAADFKQGDAPAPFQDLNDVRELIVEDGVRLELPGIYAWKIEGIGIYVGKYTHSSRPLREYNRNVARLLSGKSYRRQKPDGFRNIHRELARAVVGGLNIELNILENCSASDLNEREKYFISTMAFGNLNR